YVLYTINLKNIIIAKQLVYTSWGGGGLTYVFVCEGRVGLSVLVCVVCSHGREILRVFGFVFYRYGWGVYTGLFLLGLGLISLDGVVFMVGVRSGDAAYSFMVTILVYFLSSSLIPIVLLVFGWGYQPERLEAGYYLIFYTLFGSLPLLLRYLFVWFSHRTFLVKMPMFLTHLWLLRAHVEAPVGALCFWRGLACCGLRVIIVSVVGAVIVRFLCLRQYDIRSLVAYSSVAHIEEFFLVVLEVEGGRWF
uniref:NADH-ubiquinone oxidoreductase chain 4 n=1 Tax=Strigamia maritima TaxID=126957 RepID=T1JLP5_STRMM